MVVGQFSLDVDVLVIGGGPAGYTAAFTAAALGKTVAIVDPEETLGGDCLHKACIPSKSALHDVDGAKTIAILGKGLEQRCSVLDIERLHGFAHFENAKTVQITGEVVSVVKFKKAIIASGSSPRIDSAFNQPHVSQVEEVYGDFPSSNNVLVVGNTPGAIEAATFLCASRTVSLWCDGPLLPTFDASLVKLVQRPLSKKIAILKDKPTANDFDNVVLATHRAPRTDSLQLAAAKIEVSTTGISVNDSCQTSNPKIYAVGECAGCEHSAALAIVQGRVAAEHACGLDSHVDSTFIPQVVWSTPEIAQCGVFNQEHTVSIKWGNSGLAVALGCHDGVTMLSYDKNSQAILGIGIAGAGAIEMIAQGVLALEMGATLYDIATTLHPHPTRSEMLSEAAQVAIASLR